MSGWEAKGGKYTYTNNRGKMKEYTPDQYRASVARKKETAEKKEHEQKHWGDGR